MPQVDFRPIADIQHWCDDDAMSITMSLLVLIGGATGEHGDRSRAMAREQQWLYREVLGDGAAKPTAAFLSWDYSEVAFTATCDRQAHELVLRSKLETGANAQHVEPVEISSAHGAVKLRTEVLDGYLEGRTKVTSELRAVLQRDGDLEVFIPTDMGEPLYVGRAQPLRQVGLACRP
jgi:hypothetical protein